MKDNDVEPAVQVRLSLDERLGPASRITAERSTRLVEAALDQWQAPVKQQPKVAWRSLAWVASMVLALSFGARALYVWVAAEPVLPNVVAQTTWRAVAAHERPRAPSASPQNAGVETTAEVAGDPVVDAVAPEVLPKVRVNHEDGLLRANRLRAEGRYAEAVQVYQRVIQQEQGVSSYVARVAAASLMLDHLDNPRGAAVLLNAARKQLPGGSLDVEIERGLAEAAQRVSESAPR